MPTVTMTAALSQYGANLALNLLFRPRSTLYLGLHYSDPDGALPNEVVGGGYVRDNIAFAAPAARGVVSTNAQVFSGMVVDQVRYLGIWDSISAGNLVAKLYLGTDYTLTTIEDGKVLLAAGDVAFAF